MYVGLGQTDGGVISPTIEENLPKEPDSLSIPVGPMQTPPSDLTPLVVDNIPSPFNYLAPLELPAPGMTQQQAIEEASNAYYDSTQPSSNVSMQQPQGASYRLPAPTSAGSTWEQLQTWLKTGHNGLYVEIAAGVLLVLALKRKRRR